MPLTFFETPHPSDSSRIKRIQERITELEKLEKAEAEKNLAQLKTAAESIAAEEHHAKEVSLRARL